MPITACQHVQRYMLTGRDGHSQRLTSLSSFAIQGCLQACPRMSQFFFASAPNTAAVLDYIADTVLLPCSGFRQGSPFLVLFTKNRNPSARFVDGLMDS
ncbi:unnamed protein product [Sphagnum troendelagicum]|uniref:Uncharacterized protein n=1 Tax=Sphagnum troendelagicum TaxID=128251 RepID=A0ABP0TVR6_9BRYO